MASAKKVFYVYAKDVKTVIDNVGKLNFAGDKVAQAVEKFVSTYKRWHENREDMCVKLKALADEIDSDHNNANVAKLVGGSVGIASSVAMVVGSIAAPFTLGIGLAIAIPAGVVAGAAALTSGGALITDKVLQCKHRDEALKHIYAELEMRKEMAQCLQEVKEASSEFEEALNAIAACTNISAQKPLHSTEEMEMLIFKMKKLQFCQDSLKKVLDNWRIIKGAKELIEKSA